MAKSQGDKDAEAIRAAAVKGRLIRKVEHLDRHAAKHRDQGETVLSATVKALVEIRQERKKRR